MRTYTMLLAALVAAVACGLGAGPRVAAGQSPGSLADINVGLAAVWYPPDEHLEVFAVDDSGTVRGVWKEHNSVWRPPFSLTPPNFAPPGAPLAAVYYPNGEQLEVFVVRNGALSVVWKAKGKDWQPPAGITRPNFAREGAPLSAVYYPNDEHLEVFVAGNGAVQVVWKAQGGGWQPPGTITGPNFAPNNAPLSAVYYPNGEQLEVFVVGNDGVVRGVWKSKGGDWQANVTLTGPDFASTRAPVAAVYQPRNE